MSHGTRATSRELQQAPEKKANGEITDIETYTQPSGVSTGIDLSNKSTVSLVLPLDDVSATIPRVGGKGASMARMASAGLPVPHGFHITTAAYRRFVTANKLQGAIVNIALKVNVNDPATLNQAEREIARLFTDGFMPDDITEAVNRAYVALGGDELPVAVRSSATAEDLPQLSFAGQQDTFLNIRGKARVLDAVKRCWVSLWTARAIGYRARNGITQQDVSLAVVVQELIPAEVSGVLFTVNPVTGARHEAIINAAWGLGESVVGGQVTPDTIVVDKTTGKIMNQEIVEKKMLTVLSESGTHEEPVPESLRSEPALNPEQITELVRLGIRLENLYAQPTDIEWVLNKGRFFIIQARPITALPVQQTEEWNDSFSGDYLWSNGNLGEAVPDVMTPCTWSLLKLAMEEAQPLWNIKRIKEYHPMGNIGGRFYLNVSVNATVANLFRSLGNKSIDTMFEVVYGRIPEGIKVPPIPVSRWRLLWSLIVNILPLYRRERSNLKNLSTFLVEAPAKSEALRADIQATKNTTGLLHLWESQVKPYFLMCGRMLDAATSSSSLLPQGELRKMMGEEDANALFSGVTEGGSQLASLELLLGLEQLERGKIDRATYARRYGHRGPHEAEISISRPGEDPDWIDRQLAGLREAPQSVASLLAHQEEKRAEAWERFKKKYPGKEQKMRERLEKVGVVDRNREAARSELIRSVWVLRCFVLRAGELTRQGEGLFFLSIEEILAGLGGDQSPIARIPVRRATYERYLSLPPYPALIRGHFDPFLWAANPKRRSDMFDESGAEMPVRSTITGFAGSAGVVEARARVLFGTDHGDQLQTGEVLVTTVTNVGWTPLFPRAAAIVTDVGAPLSHASIVARELGIPAVVGCGNATMRIHTGDLLRVNGNRGIVEVLKPGNTA